MKRTVELAEKEEFDVFTIEELNERISKSEEDFENARVKTTAELLSKYKS